MLIWQWMRYNDIISLTQEGTAQQFIVRLRNELENLIEYQIVSRS